MGVEMGLELERSAACATACECAPARERSADAPGANARDVRRLRTLATGLFVAAGLAACAQDSDVETTVLRTTAIYSPTTGDIPVPNDLLFAGSTDGTLAIPLPANPAEQGPTLALNALDGWSTNAVMRVPFSEDLDGSTLTAGSTVRMFEVSTVPVPGILRGAPVESVTRELTTAEFEVGVAPESASTLTIAPTELLQPETTYMVVVTDDVLGADGFAVMRSIVYQLASQSETLPADDPLAPLQQQILAMHAAAAGAGVAPSDIVISFAFTTQSIGDVVASLRQIAQGDEAALIDAVCMANAELICTDTTPSPFSSPSLTIDPSSPGSTGTLIGSPADAADVYTGELTLPYYLEDAATVANPTDLSVDTTPRTTVFRARYPFGASDSDRNVTGFNPLPEAREQETVPVLLTVPKGAPPAGGWPIAIYQHGVTSERTTLFALADTLASAGFAAIAIDLPLHGIGPSHPFAGFLFAGHQDDQVRERHFGLDLVDNTTGAAGDDGTLDATGTHFINLTSLRTSRDNVRQAVADLFALATTLDTADYDGVAGADFDTSQLYFIGHSLGAVVGTPYLTASPEVVAAVLGMPGGGLAEVLSESPSFGPTIDAGLAAAGIAPDTPEYEAFVFAAQTVLDDADPINYAATLETTDKPLLLFEIVGDGGANLQDQTILNTVPGAPLAGTEPLIEALELAGISTSTTNATGLRGAVRFTAGDHTSLLVPLSSPAATFEMQNMTAEFFSTAGQMVTVINGAVIQ